MDDTDKAIDAAFESAKDSIGIQLPNLFRRKLEDISFRKSFYGGPNLPELDKKIMAYIDATSEYDIEVAKTAIKLLKQQGLL